MIKGLSETEHEIVNSILSPYKAHYKFFAYGSRVKGNFRQLSDLDIYVESVDKDVSISDIESLKTAFDNSNLSFIVNFSYDVSEDFYKLIEKDFVAL